jgi:hypothetical protein
MRPTLTAFVLGTGVLLTACTTPQTPKTGSAPERLTRQELIDLGREAYIYGYPLVDGYNVLRNYALDSTSPEYKGPLNTLTHTRRTARPEDRAVIAPNVDSPYSHAWLDLRNGPVRIAMPPFGADRYVSLQLIDLYTFIVGYVSPRTFGRSGGDYLVVGPGWAGDTTGVRHVFRCPTQLCLAFFRTQQLTRADLTNVHAVQDGMSVQAMDTTPTPPIPLLPPIDLRKDPFNDRFWPAMDVLLRLCPMLPEDSAARSRFAQLHIGSGPAYALPDTATLAALRQGMQQGMAEMGERARNVRSSSELFGTRAQLIHDPLTRAVGAMLGIYGNSAEEFLGVGYQADAEGRPFDGAHAYRITFKPGTLPPVDAFWSITVYTQEKLLYANPLERYVINSPMLPTLKKDADGSITLYVQHTSPGAKWESNWLPVPEGPFGLTFRTYQPQDPIRTGQWTAPPVIRQ